MPYANVPADKIAAMDSCAGKVVIIGPETQGDVQTIEGTQYIRSKNNRLWSIAALESAVSMFEGAKVYDDHLTDAEFQQRGGMAPPGRDWLGSLFGVAW